MTRERRATSWWATPWATPLLMTVVMLLVPAGWLGPVAATAAGEGAAAAAGAQQIQLLSQRRLDPRLVELTLRTSALTQDPTHVRVLVPDGYDASTTRRYPVLYLMHGGAGSYADWTNPALGDAERLTTRLALITVMPDAGQGGWFTDWYNHGAFGPPEWETYHIDQLVPWIDAHFRTIADRSGRGIAGLSMGGFGALSYAARHPDLFVSAAGFSGAVDINQPNPIVAGHTLDTIAMLDGGTPGSLFGLREAQDVRWRAHNPWDLAGNLRGLSLALHTGNGQAGGPYGGGGLSEVPPFETVVHPENVSLDQRLTALGIRHSFDDYGPGGHDWPYWRRDLTETLPSIMAAFADPPPAPSPFTFTAVEPTYGVYGWTVSVARPALEFSTLKDAGPSGFGITGSGTATVTTGRLYRPGSVHAVTEHGSFGATRQIQRASGDGRLRVSVPLGPANPIQEMWTSDGDGQPLPATRVYASTVAIAPASSGSGSGPVGEGRPAPVKGCASRRRLLIHVGRPGTGHVVTATVYVNGRRVGMGRVRRTSVLVDLGGLPAGRVTVKVVLRTRRGRLSTLRRHYRTCVTHRSGAHRR